MSYIVKINNKEHEFGLGVLEEKGNNYVIGAISNDIKYERVFKDIKANTSEEAKRAVLLIIQESFNKVFFKDDRFTSSTYVLAQMKPQANSSRFYDHILDSRKHASWVKGYIISEHKEHIVVLVDSKYEVECYSDEVIIINNAI